MEIQAKQATVKGPPETFTGDVWFDVITGGEDYARMRVNVVRFAPSARTAWHAHPGGQTLYVTWCSPVAGQSSRSALVT
jgi:quercetin dioxygenase-like cupin family protein